MSDDRFLDGLRRWESALASHSFDAPDDLSRLAIDLGKALSVATTRFMLERQAEGATELDLVAVFPLALAFVVNGLVFCTGVADRPAAVRRLLETTIQAAAQTGAGLPVESSKASTN